MFTESKVDEVLRGYFKIDQKEKQLLENKKQQTNLIKEERKNKISKIKNLFKQHAHLHFDLTIS